MSDESKQTRRTIEALERTIDLLTRRVAELEARWDDHDREQEAFAGKLKELL